MLYKATKKRYASPANGRLIGLCAALTFAASVACQTTMALGDDESPMAISHGFGAAFSAREPDSTQSQTLAPGQIVIEVDPSLVSRTARWDPPPEARDRSDILARVARSLQTVTQLRDGNTVSGAGSGFAVGHHLITALHVLQGPDYDAVVDHYAMLDGRQLQPVASFPQADIAIVQLPSPACSDCESLQFADLHDVYPDQTISWLSQQANQPTTKQARVIGFATLSSETGDGQSGCADNLVVLTDLPFEQGSSGGPVIDRQSGKILGIIQGSLTQTTLASGVSDPGFFKPIACIADLADLGKEHPGGHDSMQRRFDADRDGSGTNILFHARN